MTSPDMPEASAPGGHDTIVFIPAWNEAQNLPGVFGDIAEHVPNVDVLVVDDGSTDDTAAVARNHGAEVLSFERNRGLRAAIAAGYTYANGHGYAYCGRLDGTDSTRPLSSPVCSPTSAPAVATSPSARGSRRARTAPPMPTPTACAAPAASARP
jgi:cellulose synthase/poly-beta-1,6-N-acetylglucosamine synthase-like glycosyltransferase